MQKAQAENAWANFFWRETLNRDIKWGYFEECFPAVDKRRFWV